MFVCKELPLTAKIHLALREIDSCGYPRGRSIDWPALVETKTLLFWIIIKVRHFSKIFRFTTVCYFYFPWAAAVIISAFLSTHLPLYCQCFFSMVPGKISERTLLAMRVTVFGPSVPCFTDYWTDCRLAALNQVFTALVLVISGQREREMVR